MSAPSAPLTSATILEAAHALVRRFGEAKTNMVDIGKALGVSHAALYRFYPSKSAVMDAIVEEAMHEEEQMAARYLEAEGSAAERLKGIIIDLFNRKRQRFIDEPEVYGLYRRVLVERQDMIDAYSARMTCVLASLVEQAVQRKEWRVDNAQLAAEVIRDSVTVYVHPLFIAHAIETGAPVEKFMRATLGTLTRAFEAGVTFEDN